MEGSNWLWPSISRQDSSTLTRSILDSKGSDNRSACFKSLSYLKNAKVQTSDTKDGRPPSLLAWAWTSGLCPNRCRLYWTNRGKGVAKQRETIRKHAYVFMITSSRHSACVFNDNRKIPFLSDPFWIQIRHANLVPFWQWYVFRWS